MDCKGVIFDFNGTLFWDSEKHEIAWREFSKEIRGRELNEEEFKTKVHGRTNKLILEYIIGEDCEESRIDELSKEKERLYRNLCKEDKDTFKLVPGAEKFFDYLKEKEIPFTIATASIKENKECIVFEDAISGIKSASNAGVKEIIVIDRLGKKESFKEIKGVKRIIKDFNELL